MSEKSYDEIMEGKSVLEEMKLNLSTLKSGLFNSSPEQKLREEGTIKCLEYFIPKLELEQTRSCECTHPESVHTREIDTTSWSDDYTSSDACTECECSTFREAKGVGPE